MRPINSFIASTFLISTFSHAAEWQCFKFTYQNVPVNDPYRVPAIEIYREVIDGEPHVIRQEIIAQNEKVDDALTKFSEGDDICLKGRKGHTSLYKFFAYDIK